MPYTLRQEEQWRKEISRAARTKGIRAPEVIERSGEWYERYFFQYFKKYIQHRNSKTTILDLGCGTGTISKKLQSLEFEVHGVDFSEEVISLARRQAKDVHFQVAPIYALPFPAEFFDIVICLGVFQTVGDLQKALQEISRVVKPGGLLAVRTLNSLSMGSLFLSRDTMRYSNPFKFLDRAKDIGFKRVSLRGVYVFPWIFRTATAFVFHTRLFKIFNVLFLPIFVFLSHSFYLELQKEEK